MLRTNFPLARWLPNRPLTLPPKVLASKIPTGKAALVLSLGQDNLFSMLKTVAHYQGRNKLDVTTSDVNLKSLTRSFTVLCLIIDDHEGLSNDDIFDVLVNSATSNSSAAILKAHKARLYEILVDNKTWSQSNYGQILKFGDSWTFDKIKQSLQRNKNLHLPTSTDGIHKAAELDTTASQFSMNTSRMQFIKWCKSLRENLNNVKYRIVYADPMAFTFTLQNVLATNRKSLGANWYRMPGSFTPFSLTGGDYEASNPERAPLQFDAVHTQHSLDALSTMNMLISCSPLLQCRGDSILSTETVVPRGMSDIAAMKKIIGGKDDKFLGFLGMSLAQWSETDTDTLLSHNLEYPSSRILNLTWRQAPRYLMPQDIHLPASDINALCRAYLRAADKNDHVHPADTSSAAAASMIAFRNTMMVRWRMSHSSLTFPHIYTTFAGDHHRKAKKVRQEVMLYDKIFTPTDSTYQSGRSLGCADVNLIPRDHELDSSFVTVELPEDWSLSKAQTGNLQVSFPQYKEEFSVLHVGYNTSASSPPSGSEPSKTNPPSCLILVSFMVPSIMVQDGNLFKIMHQVDTSMKVPNEKKVNVLKTFKIGQPGVHVSEFPYNTSGLPIMHYSRANAPSVDVEDRKYMGNLGIYFIKGNHGVIKRLKFRFHLEEHPGLAGWQNSEAIKVESESAVSHMLCIEGKHKLRFMSPLSLATPLTIHSKTLKKGIVFVTGSPLEHSFT